jgi:hypothetical protein
MCTSVSCESVFRVPLALALALALLQSVAILPSILPNEVRCVTYYVVHYVITRDLSSFVIYQLFIQTIHVGFRMVSGERMFVYEPDERRGATC